MIIYKISPVLLQKQNKGIVLLLLEPSKIY